MALMMCDSQFIDQATGQCLKWVEYVPLVPNLSNEMIGMIWGSFLVSLLVVWNAKKLVRLFGV